MHRDHRLQVLCLSAVALLALAVGSSASPRPIDTANEQGPPVAASPEPVYVAYFFLRSFRLDFYGKEVLDDVALEMKEAPDSHAMIIGYVLSDEIGVSGLGKSRAESVKSYLVTHHGIDPARMATSGRTVEEQSDSIKQIIARERGTKGLAVLTLSRAEEPP